MSRSAPRTFLGGLLIAVGGLIATLSGLCSLAVIGASYSAVLKGPGVLGNLIGGLLLVGVVGGVPFVLGVGLVIGGLAIIRSSPPSGG